MSDATKKDEVKAGGKSTEFYVNVGTAVAGVLVAANVITPEQSSSLVHAVSAIVGGIMTIGATIGYTIARYKAKKNG